jgi:thiol-disulfide isomerase/thioredoxin
LKAAALIALLALALPASGQALKEWKGGATPALALEDVDGKLHRLADYKGKVVLINFWATWCAPCREEMPSMQALGDSLQGKPFAVLAINVGEGPRAARDFAEKMALRFPILLDRDMNATRAWSARVLPASYVVGPDSKVAYSYLGAIDWNAPQVKGRLERLMPK